MIDLHKVLVRKFKDRKFSVSGEGKNQKVTFFDGLPEPTQEELARADAETKRQDAQWASQRDAVIDSEFAPDMMRALVKKYVFDDESELLELRLKADRLRDES